MKQPHFSFYPYLMGCLSFLAAIAYLFGILTKVDYWAAFILTCLGCAYLAIGFVARKHLSPLILACYAAAVVIQMSYWLYLENRFTPAPILLGIILIYDGIKDYQAPSRKREHAQ